MPTRAGTQAKIGHKLVQMQAELSAARLSLLQLRLLDALTQELLESLDSAVRADRISKFARAYVAREADLWLRDERGIPRLASSPGTAGALDKNGVLEIPLSAHGRQIGSLRLSGLHEIADRTFLDRFAHHCSYSLYNARSYEHEQRVSVTFQNGAIGVTLPIVPGVVFDAVYEAGRSEALVGGDWYDAFLLHDGRFVVSVGDVAGSGLNAAVTMVNVRQSLRGVAYVHADPVFMLRAAEETLRSQYPDRYVTAFVAVIDPVTQTCSYANAGHPPPLLRWSDGAVRFLLGRSLPLGMHDFDAGFEPNHISLPPGSLLVLYTDGITEATRNPIEGEGRLIEAVAAIGPETTNVARAIHAAAVPVHASDDVAILTVHFETAALVRRWRFDPRWSDAARRVRHELLEEMIAQGLPPSERFFVEVAFAELMANLVRHAEGTAELILERRGSDFTLHAIDKGPGFHFNPRLPSDLFSERGRGLFLVSHIAQDFTVEHRPGGGSHARIVFKGEPS